MEPAQNSSEPKRQSKSLALVIIVLLALIPTAWFWQQSQVNKLNNQVAELKKNQLPSTSYASFDECSQNGGILLTTVNVQFNGCLGGKLGDASHQAFMQYSAQNLPRLEEDKINDPGDKNVIVSGVAASSDLTQFLENSYSGCAIGSAAESVFQPGYFKVRKEITNRFALVGYGCADGEFLDKTLSIAIKLADGWRFISTTNNMNDEGIPSCLVVDMFKISKELTPQCFENTGYNNGDLKDVTYL